MSDEKHKVDMSRHQGPYRRGPQARKNLDAEFAREFPGEKLAAGGDERYDLIEQRLLALANARKAQKASFD